MIADMKTQSQEQRPPLWTSEEVNRLTGSQSTGEWNANGVTIDSRSVEPGDLFIAIKGERHDGHEFVADALSKGAAAAIVEAVPSGVPEDKCVVVGNPVQALRDLARVARSRISKDAAVIGITGSVGKTGTKEMMTAAFEGQCKVHCSKKSYNNHLGVPLTLASMPQDTEVGIFEIGMNHAGEISQLTRQVQPTISIITTVQLVHLENLGTPENIAKAKAEIMEGMVRGQTIFLNKDNKFYDFLYERAKAKGLWIFSFGRDQLSDTHIKELNVLEDGTAAKLSILDDVYDLDFSFSGEHHTLNTLPVLMAVKLLGYDMEEAMCALEEWTPGQGRGQKEIIKIKAKKAPITVLNESYNASPVAMRAAFSVMSVMYPEEKGRRIAIMGDMAELGSNRVGIHAELALYMENAGIDYAYTCGPLMKNLFDNLLEEYRGEHFRTPEDCAEAVSRFVQPGDIILVKGSRGDGEQPKMQVIIEALRAMAIE